jgi:hypothetical protein
MGQKVRSVRLLVAVSAAALLGLVAAWPSQGAVTETPLYLARDAQEGRLQPTVKGFVAVADGPRLAAHLLGDGEQLAGMEVIDGAGRVVVLHPNGTVEDTGVVVEPAVVKAWLVDSFKARARTVDQQVVGDPSNKECWTAKQRARAWLNLSGRAGTRELTLAETLADADRRIAQMHHPANQIPVQCLANPSHKAGYLHNLWHRIRGA